MLSFVVSNPMPLQPVSCALLHFFCAFLVVLQVLLPCFPEDILPYLNGAPSSMESAIVKDIIKIIADHLESQGIPYVDNECVKQKAFLPK
jgi:hypothetical protein